MTTTPTTIHARVAAELAVARGDIATAALILEQAFRSAPPEHRVALEEARAWLDEITPPRLSWVGDA